MFNGRTKIRGSEKSQNFSRMGIAYRSLFTDFLIISKISFGIIFENAQILPKVEDIDYIKSVITPLYTKTNNEAVAMYANAIYIAAATNKIRFVKGSGIGKFS